MNDAKYIGMDVHQATISVAVRDSRAYRRSGFFKFPIIRTNQELTSHDWATVTCVLHFCGRIIEFHRGSAHGGAPNTKELRVRRGRCGTLHASCATGNLNNRPSDPIKVRLAIQPTSSPVTRQIRHIRGFCDSSRIVCFPMPIDF